jgi:hypothetical protein
MDWLLSQAFLQAAAVAMFLWLILVAGGYWLAVESGAAPRAVIRLLYGLFLMAVALYLALLSPYRGFFTGVRLWALAIIVMLIVGALALSYPTKRRT